MKPIMMTLIAVLASFSGFNTALADQIYFSDEQICKAGIARSFHRSPSLMSTYEQSGSIYYISYKKDGKNWTYKCKIQGSQIIWGASDGRFRDEANISYKVDEATKALTIREVFNDGSVASQSFSRAVFNDSNSIIDTGHIFEETSIYNNPDVALKGNRYIFAGVEKSDVAKMMLSLSSDEHNWQQIVNSQSGILLEPGIEVGLLAKTGYFEWFLTKVRILEGKYKNKEYWVFADKISSLVGSL